MATYSSILAWRITWTEEPGGLQSMQSQRVGPDRVTNTLSYLTYFIYLHTYIYSNNYKKCRVILDPHLNLKHKLSGS